MKKRIHNRSLISYIVFLLVTLLFLLFYRQIVFFILFLIEIALFFLSYNITAINFKKTRITTEFTSTLIYIGETTSYNINIKKEKKIPFSSMETKINIVSEYYGQEKERKYVFPLLAKKEQCISFPIEPQKCGMYTATFHSYVMWDFFHIFGFYKEQTQKNHLLVYPKSAPIPIPMETLYAEGFDEFEESQKSGLVSANVTDIREYQPGDRLQKIHWKLSTKLDKLFVKENESTSSNQLCLLPELYTPVYNPNQISNELETAITQTYGICLWLISINYPFLFQFYSNKQQDFISHFIACRDDLENAFREMYYASSYHEENLALNIYERVSEHKGILLHISHKGVTDVTTD